MNNRAEGQCGDKVAADQARAELDRLLADRRFKITDRNRAFLRYIAEESFAGHSRGVKAYSIAIDVFGRASDFDANVDPIVRIEATRLRASLDQYYEAHGSEHPIHIHLPRGNYIAEFTRVDGSTPCVEEGAASAHRAEVHEESVSAMPDGTQPRRIRRNLSMLAAGFLLAVGTVAAGGYLALIGSQAEQPSPKPLVTLSVTTRNPADKPQAEQLEDALLMSLIRFGTLRLASKTDFSSQRSMRAIAPPAADADADYNVSLKYTLEGGIQIVSWRIAEISTGQTRASGEERVGADESGGSQNDVLLAALGQHFGAAVGELNTIELVKTHGRMRLGNSCVLQAENAISLLIEAGLKDAADCLEATLADNPEDPDASAVLSRILMIQDYYAGNKTRATRSLALAERAIAAQPSSDRAQIARIVSLYAAGRHEEAFRIGRDAVRKNPYNKDLASVLAFRLFVAGNASEGVALVRKVGLIDDLRPRNTLIVLAMAAYCDGRPGDALQMLEDVAISDRLVQATRIASLVRLRRQSEAVAALDRAVERIPRFMDTMERLFRTKNFNAHLGEMLKADIGTAVEWQSEAAETVRRDVN